MTYLRSGPGVSSTASSPAAAAASRTWLSRPAGYSSSVVTRSMLGRADGGDEPAQRGSEPPLVAELLQAGGVGRHRGQCPVDLWQRRVVGDPDHGEGDVEVIPGLLQLVPAAPGAPPVP